MVENSTRHQAQRGLQIVGVPSRSQSLVVEAGLGGLFLLEQVQRDAAQDGQVLRAVAHAHPAGVLVKAHVQRPVERVLYGPVAADEAVELGSRPGRGC